MTGRLRTGPESAGYERCPSLSSVEWDRDKEILVRTHNQQRTDDAQQANISQTRQPQSSRPPEQGANIKQMQKTSEFDRNNQTQGTNVARKSHSNSTHNNNHNSTQQSKSNHRNSGVPAVPATRTRQHQLNKQNRQKQRERPKSMYERGSLSYYPDADEYEDDSDEEVSTMNNRLGVTADMYSMATCLTSCDDLYSLHAYNNQQEHEKSRLRFSVPYSLLSSLSSENFPVPPSTPSSSSVLTTHTSTPAPSQPQQTKSSHDLLHCQPVVQKHQEQAYQNYGNYCSASSSVRMSSQTQSKPVENKCNCYSSSDSKAQFANQMQQHGCIATRYLCPYCHMQFSSSTGGNLPSRLMGLPGGRQRPQRKKKKKPFQRRVNGRANSFSSITDSTMSLNIITVTLSMETTSFLGISIVGQTHKQGDGGIYVGTIMPGGAVAQDGRIEPGDMILQVNEYSFENMSNDDAVKILRDVVVRPGPIKLVVAKCWNPNPQSYLSLPKANDHMSQQLRSTAGDPQSWVEQASRMMNYKGGGPGGGGSGPISPSLASVTSDGSLSSSLPESSIIYPGRADSTNYLLAAITGAPPPSASGAPTFSGGGPGGQMGNMISGGGSGGGSVGTPGSGGPGQMVGPNGTPIFGMSSADYHQQQQQQENMGGAMGMGMIGGHHLSTKTDVLTVLRAVQMPNSGLEIKDRMWLKITIPNAFLGHSLVDWLFEHLDGFSVRRDAHKYASRLLKDGFIKHTTGKASFSEQCYYIFNSEHAITNMNNLSYPGDNSNAGANLKQRERDPLEVDEENDVLAPLPYASPWGAPQYMGYQPRTAGYQGNQPLPPPPMGHPGAGPQGAFTVNELDSFGPMGMGGMSHQQMPMVSSAQQQQLMSNGGHSSPGSSNSSNRSGVGQNHSHSHNGNRAASGGTGSSNKIPLCGGGGGLSDSLSDLDCSASQRMGPTHSNSSEYFVDPM
ncbi:uncharacterized protein LOC134846855 isoform X2 [Symsagittifera roscoffensis]|uniref:uncharacterized protein LOC134846855 isoform X2 n=1 Tax=Symsagittifera roscoffensis TaxID=84072 RepID=UPI00307CB738